jgi:hypothetical protein
MKVEQEELTKINDRMKGWTIDKVDSGNNGEQVFIFHLSKGKNSRMVVLSANDLGGWLQK